MRHDEQKIQTIKRNAERAFKQFMRETAILDSVEHDESEIEMLRDQEQRYRNAH